MPTEFYVEIQFLILTEKLQSQFFAVTAKLNDDKSDRLKSATFCNSGMLPPNVDHHACAGIPFTAAVTVSLCKNA